MANLTITLNKVKADIEFPIILENIDSGEVVLFLNKFDRVVLKSAGGRGPYYISSWVDLYDTNVWRRFSGSIEISNDTPSASTELPENVTDKVQALAEQHGIACDAKLNQFAIDLLSTTTAPKTYPPFPVMLRKMWTGSEVQDWIDGHIIQALPTKTSSLTPVKNTEKPIQEWKQVPVNLTEDMHTKGGSNNAELLQAQRLDPDQSSSTKEIEGLLLTIARQQAQINLFEKKLKEFTDAVGAEKGSIQAAKLKHETQALTPDNKDPMFSIVNAVSIATPTKEGDKNAAGQESCTILPPKQEGALSEDMKLPIVYLRKDQLKQLKRRGPLLGELNNSPRPDLVGLYLLNPEVLDGNN